MVAIAKNIGSKKPATKGDLEDLREDLQADMERMRLDLKADIQDSKEEILYHFDKAIEATHQIKRLNLGYLKLTIDKNIK